MKEICDEKQMRTFISGYNVSEEKDE